MGTVIVTNNMNIELCRDVFVNSIKEFSKLDAAVTAVAFTEHLSGSRIEGGKQ